MNLIGNVEEPQISRRTFMKLSAVTAATLIAPPILLSGCSSKTEGDVDAENLSGEITFFPLANALKEKNLYLDTNDPDIQHNLEKAMNKALHGVNPTDEDLLMMVRLPQSPYALRISTGDNEKKKIGSDEGGIYSLIIQRKSDTRQEALDNAQIEANQKIIVIKQSTNGIEIQPLDSDSLPLLQHGDDFISPINTYAFLYDGETPAGFLAIVPGQRILDSTGNKFKEMFKFETTESTFSNEEE